MLYSQLPFANGDRFVRLVLHSEAEDNVELDLDAYHAIRDTSKSFAHLGAVGDGEYALEGEDGSVEAIRVGLVTPRVVPVSSGCADHRPRADPRGRRARRRARCAGSRESMAQAIRQQPVDLE
jgi:hypothetical protein